MTANDILAFFQQPHSGGICLVSIIALLSLLEVSKIKINPWTWLARKFGNAINHDISERINDVNDKISDLESSINEIKDQQGVDRAVTWRIRILRFNEELLRNQRHSKESFDQVMDDITSYNFYCHEHPNFENAKAVMAIQNIRKAYQKCMDDRDFL